MERTGGPSGGWLGSKSYNVSLVSRHCLLPSFLSPQLCLTLNLKVSWDRLKRVWRRPKTPLRTSTGGISTLGLQELKEQVRVSLQGEQPAPSPGTERSHDFWTGP